MSKIELRNIELKLNDKNILNDISLNLDKGDFVGLIGPNGSGKSTLLRTIYKSLKPDRGKIFLEGEDIEKLKTKEFAKKLAVLNQEHELSFNFKVIDIVMLGRFTHKNFLETTGKKDKSIAEEALKRVGMYDFMYRDYFTLSGGEKQRVMLAMAFAKQTDIFLFDEPTNHLDIKYQLSIMNVIKSQKDITVFSSLHDLNIASKYCDKLILIDNGKVVLTGDAKSILKSKQLQDVFKVEIYISELPNGDLGINFLNEL